MKGRLTNILLTLTSLFGLGVSAVALEQREAVVTVPFDFVVGGKTLPAGTYTVGRVSYNRLGALSISSYDTRSGAFVIPNQFAGHSMDNSRVTFEHVGDMYYLRSIETRDGTYTIPLPHARTIVAKAKQNGGMSAPGAN
jgi:hypothetical protein